ncbi:substrate-binding domain-containing protein [Nostocoides vanveenii]|uniref:substrate-binding domain-containing protein n=1 Tax=Nostocoides vanveenii TaxID=330835 RepID=UPI0031D82252
MDGIFSLNADIATGAAIPAAEAVNRGIKIGTLDLSGDAVQAIKDGKMEFAIDQQQYAQGYLPVVLLYVNKLDGLVLGGGKPMYTGPGFVTKENADLVQKLADAGTR